MTIKKYIYRLFFYKTNLKKSKFGNVIEIEK